MERVDTTCVANGLHVDMFFRKHANESRWKTLLQEKGKRKKEKGFSVRSSCGGDGDLIDDGERARGVGGELEKAE